MDKQKGGRLSLNGESGANLFKENEFDFFYNRKVEDAGIIYRLMLLTDNNKIFLSGTYDEIINELKTTPIKDKLTTLVGVVVQWSSPNGVEEVKFNQRIEYIGSLSANAIMFTDKVGDIRGLIGLIQKLLNCIGTYEGSKDVPEELGRRVKHDMILMTDRATFKEYGTYDEIITKLKTKHFPQALTSNVLVTTQFVDKAEPELFNQDAKVTFQMSVTTHLTDHPVEEVDAIVHYLGEHLSCFSELLNRGDSSEDDENYDGSIDEESYDGSLDIE